jgi:hypothetical protein
MDLHQNARLSFRSREALARKIMMEKVTLNAAAAALRWVQPLEGSQLPPPATLANRGKKYSGCDAVIPGNGQRTYGD